jgi:type IV pilus assembly protein PilN
MIRINLLPIRAARKKENVRWQVSVFFLMILFGVVVMAYMAVSLSRNISSMNTKIEEAGRELKDLEAISKKVTEIKDKLQKLQAKMDVIQTLEVNRTRSIRILETLTGLVIADRMWLTNLTETDGTLNMKGMAMDNKTIADFMKALEGSPYFASVNLITSRQVEQQKKAQVAGVFKEFNITCRVQMPKTQKEPQAS